MGPSDPAMGSALTVRIPAPAGLVRIRYSTGENASGLQWLDPPQTFGNAAPFLFTQSEATHCRSWIPIQDTPQVRMTYTARIRKPQGVRAVMSAPNNPEVFELDAPRFVMPYPLPAYLMALAVGDIAFRSVSPRTGVFTENLAMDAALHELEDLDRMLAAGEKLFGPYRWGRYDVLILPPSFPIGGMENPCLTFVTPTIIAGDKSLTSLIVHELAHSWSSNLVSNATWADFWLNEGLTVYMERRLVEELYGFERAEMEGALGLEDLTRELSTLDREDQALRPRGKRRDPNRGGSEVPYEKGALLLRTIEKAVGRPRFDAFLRDFTRDFAFSSISTSQFIGYLNRKLLLPAVPGFSIEQWVYGPGIPRTPRFPSPTLWKTSRSRRAAGWTARSSSKTSMPTRGARRSGFVFCSTSPMSSTPPGWRKSIGDSI